MSKSPSQSLARTAQQVDALSLEAMPSIDLAHDVDPLADTNFTFEEKIDRTIDVELSPEKLLSMSERRLRRLQRAEPTRLQRTPQRRAILDSNLTVIDRIINWLAARIKSFRDLLMGRFDKTPPPPVKFINKTKEELEEEQREEEELILRKLRQQRD